MLLKVAHGFAERDIRLVLQHHIQDVDTTNRYQSRLTNLCLFELSVQGFSKLMKQGTGEPENVEGTQRGALDCDLEALAFCKDDATT
jgi:hypothetical protein